MNKPQNPYTKQHDIYTKRSREQDFVNSQVFYIDFSYSAGQKEGWDEGYEVGIERYFNVENENDCADTLYTYLAVLQKRIAEKFGTDSIMHELLEDFFFNLQEAPVPADAPYDPLCSLYLLDNDKLNRDQYSFMTGRIEEHEYIDGTWVQPHSWADEIN